MATALQLFRQAIGLIHPTSLRAPRIISNLQDRCGHEKAAEVAAEREKLISTIDKIA